MKRFIINHFNILAALRQWLESIEIHNNGMAYWICKAIPAQCPFERNIKFFDRSLVHIPPLCKLNPLYDQLVELRFKALIYLADHPQTSQVSSFYSS